MQLAFNVREWDGSYELDFSKLLDTPKITADTDGGESDDADDPHFSTVTGELVYPIKYNGNIQQAEEITDELDEEDLKTVSMRMKELAVISMKAELGPQRLAQRSFQGLETRYGLDAPAKLEQGRSGIARGYEHAQTDSIS